MKVYPLTGRAATQFRANVARLHDLKQVAALGRLDSYAPNDIVRLHEQLQRLPWEQLLALSRGCRSAKRPRDLAFEDLKRPSLQVPMSLSAKDENSWMLGQRALSGRRIAVLTVAAGRASRLGVGIPKGMFSFLPDGTTLFAWFAAMLHATGRRVGYVPPWVIMLSPGQVDKVRGLFEQEGYFGLPVDQVYFITQRLVPTFDDDGQLIAGEEKGTFLWNPGGHGGVFDALHDADLYRRLRRRGVTHFVYHQVDNPLAPILDPQFLGRAVSLDAECVNTAVLKRTPGERAGVFAERKKKGGKGKGGGAHEALVIEYSELPSELAEQRDADGSLTFGLANIAMHVLNLNFVEGVQVSALPWHFARKVAGMQANGDPRYVFQPERFFFDMLPQCSCPQPVIVLDRAEVFAPIKNAEGDDSATTCLEALYQRSSRWLELRRVLLPGDRRSCSGARVIIKPSHALSPFDINLGTTLQEIGLAIPERR